MFKLADSTWWRAVAGALVRLADSAWWRAVAAALVRTLIAALAPFAAQVYATPEVMDQPAWWLNMLLVVGLAVVLAVATALVGLPDPSGAWWEIALQRAVRQGGQYLLAAAAGAVLLSDISPQIWIATLGSMGATFILAAVGLGVDPTATSIGAAVAALDDPSSSDSAGEGEDLDADLVGIGEDGEIDDAGEAWVDESTGVAPAGGAVDAAGFAIV